MPKRRNIIPGMPHRITHVASNYNSIFVCPDDFQEFHGYLETCSQRQHVDVGSYLILEDRYELILRPPSREALSTFMHRLNGRYSTYFTRRYSWRGSPWMGPYQARPIAECWLLDLLRYLLQTPVRLDLVQNPLDYDWSSLASHLNIRRDSALSDYFPDDVLPEVWQSQLKVPLPG